MNGLLSVRLGAVHGAEAVPDSRSCQTLGVPRQSRGITFLFTMAQEYARRFSCEEGFRDAKQLLGFAQARIAELLAWARMFAVVAAALLLLTQLGTALLRHPQRQAWLRQVRSRRRARSEVSVVAVVCHLLDHVARLWELLDLRLKLNLEAAL